MQNETNQVLLAMPCNNNRPYKCYRLLRPGFNLIYLRKNATTTKSDLCFIHWTSVKNASLSQPISILCKNKKNTWICIQLKGFFFDFIAIAQFKVFIKYLRFAPFFLPSVSVLFSTTFFVCCWKNKFLNHISWVLA